ncbi:MAG: hypothetical protein HND59_08695 [Pseudomonadota bacterium]|nr:MAG: hypothetical protein HND59_08695 [Pseudomonadota bacterium]
MLHFMVGRGQQLSLLFQSLGAAADITIRVGAPFDWVNGKTVLNTATKMSHCFISKLPGEARPGRTGLLVPGYQARIVDEQFNDVPPVGPAPC